VIVAAARAELTSTPGIELEYFELVDPETFSPVARVDREVVAVVAARAGAIRLIDNQPIPVPSGTAQRLASRSAASAESDEEVLQCSAR